MVPCTTEPFFISIVTVSLFNFMRNLQILQSVKVLQSELLGEIQEIRSVSPRLIQCWINTHRTSFMLGNGARG